MIAVIFEVYPAEGKLAEYLTIAQHLKFELEKIEGFISIERFSSLVEEGKILSLSFWRDDEAVRQWRNLEAHRFAQKKGRAGVFSDYRLRVATICRDYSKDNREQVPHDSNIVHNQGV